MRSVAGHPLSSPQGTKEKGDSLEVKPCLLGRADSVSGISRNLSYAGGREHRKGKSKDGGESQRPRDNTPSQKIRGRGCRTGCPSVFIVLAVRGLRGERGPSFCP